MKYLAVLGRQPKISLAELISLFDNVKQISPTLATFELPQSTPKNDSNKTFDFSRLGGSLKVAQEIHDSPLKFLKNLPDHKLILGLSDYSKSATPKSTLKTALALKQQLKKTGKSVRIINTNDKILSTATSHHNQIAEKSGHIELILHQNHVYEVVYVQNISAYAARDQKRPARDAKNGMLPPKLAQILLNLAGNLPPESLILDPFCGSGVVAQEALLMQYSAFGTDLNAIMVEKTLKNLDWLQNSYLKTRKNPTFTTKPLTFTAAQGDATSHNWLSSSENPQLTIPFFHQPISAVVAETYLGPPMSTPPANIKLTEVKQACASIILGFLKNLAPQISENTPVVLAIPAWLRPNGTYESLNLLDSCKKLGYNVQKYQHLGQSDLLYYREGQVVAREIISLRKKSHVTR